jgi:AraC-like DNA-binding protein
MPRENPKTLMCRQCVKDFILCMFYTSRNSMDIRGSSLEMSLRILTSDFVNLAKWAKGDLRAPYWRLYWNDNSGASITIDSKTIPLQPRISFSSRRRHPSPTAPRPWVAEKWTHYGNMDTRVHTAIHKIEAHSPGVPSISNLAREAGMNTNAFIRLFRERTGLTPALFARECRIEVACLLLHHSAKSIEEIASTFGCCDRYHFTHAFIRSRKTSPAAFRKQIQR